MILVNCRWSMASAAAAHLICGSECGISSETVEASLLLTPSRSAWAC